jgi:hypothetical protein
MPPRQREQEKANIQEDTMTTPTIARSINSQWLRRGIAAASALLLASAAALSLAYRPSLDVAPASIPATRMSSARSAAQRHYEDFKRRQVEGLEGAGVSALSAAQLQYKDFKLREIDQRGAAAAHYAGAAPTAAQLRYEDFKLRQIDQRGATTTQHASAAQTRFIDFKLRQIDQ